MCKTEDIHNCFETYYKNLYAQLRINKKGQMKSFLKSLYPPRVAEEQIKALTVKFTKFTKFTH